MTSGKATSKVVALLNLSYIYEALKKVVSSESISSTGLTKFDIDCLVNEVKDYIDQPKIDVSSHGVFYEWVNEAGGAVYKSFEYKCWNGRYPDKAVLYYTKELL